MTTLIIQTPGAVVPLANSYLDEVASEALALKYGISAWTNYSGAGDKSTALFLGANFLETTYGPAFLGCITSTTQTMSFPRKKFYTNLRRLVPEGDIPEEILVAQLQLALLSLTGTDLFAPPPQSGNLKVLSERVEGDVARTQEWFSPNAAATSPTYAIGVGLSPYLNNAYGNRTIHA